MRRGVAPSVALVCALCCAGCPERSPPVTLALAAPLLQSPLGADYTLSVHMEVFPRDLSTNMATTATPVSTADVDVTAGQGAATTLRINPGNYIATLHYDVKRVSDGKTFEVARIDALFEVALAEHKSVSFDATKADTSMDDDGDGISNLTEVETGTPPDQNPIAWKVALAGGGGSLLLLPSGDLLMKAELGTAPGLQIITNPPSASGQPSWTKSGATLPALGPLAGAANARLVYYEGFAITPSSTFQSVALSDPNTVLWTSPDLSTKVGNSTFGFAPVGAPAIDSDGRIWVFSTTPQTNPGDALTPRLVELLSADGSKVASVDFPAIVNCTLGLPQLGNTLFKGNTRLYIYVTDSQSGACTVSGQPADRSVLAFDITPGNAPAYLAKAGGGASALSFGAPPFTLGPDGRVYLDGGTALAILDSDLQPLASVPLSLPYQRQGGEIEPPPVVTATTAYVYARGFLFAVDLATHAVAWTFPPENSDWSIGPLESDMAYAASSGALTFPIAIRNPTQTFTPAGAYALSTSGGPKAAMYFNAVDLGTSNVIARDRIMYFTGTPDPLPMAPAGGGPAPARHYFLYAVGF